MPFSPRILKRVGFSEPSSDLGVYHRGAMGLSALIAIAIPSWMGTVDEAADQVKTSDTSSSPVPSAAANLSSYVPTFCWLPRATSL